MTYLRTDISDDTLAISVSAPLSSPSYPLFRSLGSETIKVVAGADTTEWQVERGIGDTQAAFHGKGTALIADTTPYGAGGDPGEQTVYVQPTDPGAVGAGKLWVQTVADAPTGLRLQAWVSALIDEELLWLPVGAADSVVGIVEQPGGTGITRYTEAFVSLADVVLGDSGGIGTVHVDIMDGDSDVRASWHQDPSTGIAIQTNDEDGDLASKIVVTPEGNLELGATDSLSLDITDVPEVPAAPTEQDIVDALLALGLVTQAAP